MTKKLLAGAAALALIAGSGIASAQSGAQQDMKSGQQTAPSAQKSESAPSQAQGQGGQTQSQPSGDRPGSAATQDSEKKAQQGNQQRQGQQDRNGATQRQTQDKQDKKEGQAQTESKPGGGKASVELNSDQRTKISQTIKTQNVRRVTNVNFNISVGTVVPRSYSFYPVPATVVTVVPAWRGYLYLVVGDEMLIIHPRTHEIVAVIAV